MLLSAVTLALYASSAASDFVSYDDPDYVVDNPAVNRGLSPASVRWALTAFHSSNWHPLTWLSHQLDVELFGLDAGAHHLVNAGLHALNAALCLAALLAATRALWPSAFVAALFALHPLRVESVAWISERKDLLAGVFFWLCILAHVRFARRPTLGRRLGLVGAFALGLLAKPMLVTVPFVLLLLDVWPLARTARTSLPRLVVEKLPLLALAALSAAMTLAAQHAGRALQSLSTLPFGARLSNALTAYATYLLRTVWPTGLAFFHPHPALVQPGWRPWNAAALASLVLLLAATAGAAWSRSRRPYVLVGWLWFLGMLLPVVGLVQVGEQAWAERYAYLPLVGIYVAVAWGAADLVRARPALRVPAAAVALALLAAVGTATSRRIGAWRDSRSLYTSALDATEGNYVAHLLLGNLDQRAGDVAGAKAEYERALAIRPDHAPTLFDLGLLREKNGDPRGAIDSYRAAIASDPLYRPPYLNQSQVLQSLGETERAEEVLEELLALHPEEPNAHWNLGLLLAARGADAAAVEHLRIAQAAMPDSAEIERALGSACAHAGLRAEAIEHLRRSCELSPEAPVAAAQLAWILATAPEDELRDAEQALRWAGRALDTRAAGSLETMEALAAALAGAGRFAEACEWQAKAVELAPVDRRGTIRQRLKLYQQGRPFRETP